MRAFAGHELIRTRRRRTCAHEDALVRAGSTASAGTAPALRQLATRWGPRRRAREHPPERGEIALPLRGRPLRDKIVLRAIAVNRALHFFVLGLLGLAILLFALATATASATLLPRRHRPAGRRPRPAAARAHGLLGEIDELLHAAVLEAAPVRPW